MAWRDTLRSALFGNPITPGKTPSPALMDQGFGELESAFAEIDTRVEELAAEVADIATGADSIIKATWAELDAIAGTRNGQRGYVPNSDAGTHTDPVVGGTVDNAGTFSWSTAEDGWERVDDYQDITSKADDSAVVKLTGDQTVAGVKTFSSSPVVPDAAFAIAKVSGLQSALDGKLSDELQPSPGYPAGYPGADAVFGIPDPDGYFAITILGDGDMLLGAYRLSTLVALINIFAEQPEIASDAGATRYSHAMTDADGYVGLGLDERGQPRFEALGWSFESFPNIFVGTDAEAVMGAPFGIMDADGYVGFYQAADGTWLPGTGHVDSETSVYALVDDDLSPVVYTKPYDPGAGAKETVYAVSGTGETRITDGTFDAYSPVVEKNAYIKYRANRGAGLRQERTYLDGSVTFAVMDGWVVMAVMYGQSNSTPGFPDPGETDGITQTTPSLRRAFQFVGGIAPNNGNLHPSNYAVALTDDDVEALAPINFLPTPYVGLPAHPESPLYGFADIAHREDAGLVSLLVSFGVPGLGYSGLKKDTQPFDNLVDGVRWGRRRAHELGFKFRVGAVGMIHGETDEQNTAYFANMAQLKADLLAAFDAILSGDSYHSERADTQWLQTQMSNWAYDALGPETGVSVFAQRDLSRDDIWKVVTPNYIWEHTGSNIHTTARGRREQGEYFGKAFSDPAFQPLDIETAVASGSTITVSVSGRVGALQTNVYHATTNPAGVVDPGNYGFRLCDAAGAALGGISISSVALINSNTQIQITCSTTVPAGAYLGYADAGTPGNQPGPSEGPRGCICDSDDFACSDVLAAYRETTLGWGSGPAATPLRNHLLHARVLITVS